MYQSVSLVTERVLDAAALDGIPGIEDLAFDGTRTTFRTASVSRTLAGVLQRLDARSIAVTDLTVRKATLEDVFIRLTGSSVD